MWHQVVDKRPANNADCWVWRRGWKRPRKRTVHRYLHPKAGWEWDNASGPGAENMRATDWWCSIDTPPEPPKEGKL